MKKTLSISAILLSVCLLLTSCGGNQQSKSNSTSAMQSSSYQIEQTQSDSDSTQADGTTTAGNSTQNAGQSGSASNNGTTTKKNANNNITTAKPVTNVTNLNFVNGFRRGMNMGNMLEAPNEGDWGSTAKDEYFTIIKQRGFDFVRIPIKWSTHQTNWNIDETFFKRIDHVIDQALKNKLGVIINMHHFDELNSNPDTVKNGLYKMWQQIASRYKSLPASVMFEINNEPNSNMTNHKWIAVQNECIKLIRKTNPMRKIVVSAANWGGAGSINELVLPNDKNLVLSFHYYAPMTFTHQDADFAGNAGKYIGTEWNATEAEKAEIDNTFKRVRAWSQATGIPVLLGEFGAYNRAPYASRVRWTNCVRETAEKYGFSWAYWEFCSGFGVFNKSTNTYYKELADALVPATVNTKTGLTVSLPTATAVKTATTIGPVTLKTAIDYTSYSWCGYICTDTANSVLIQLGTVGDWNRVCFSTGITDTGTGFSKNEIKFTFKNVNKSITDIGFNLESKAGGTETSVKWLSDSKLTGNSDGVKQNTDGTTTVIMNISSKYSAMKGKISSGMNLKVFIESIPNHSDFDRKGSMEVLGVKCR